MITELISPGHNVDNSIIFPIDSGIRRHIYIEETMLFPKLPVERLDDVNYLEREHGKIFKTLDSLYYNTDMDELKKLLGNLLDLLLEHNSYEKSFIYDYYQDDDAKPLIGLGGGCVYNFV